MALTPKAEKYLKEVFPMVKTTSLRTKWDEVGRRLPIKDEMVLLGMLMGESCYFYGTVVFADEVFIVRVSRVRVNHATTPTNSWGVTFMHVSYHKTGHEEILSGIIHNIFPKPSDFIIYVNNRQLRERPSALRRWFDSDPMSIKTLVGMLIYAFSSKKLKQWVLDEYMKPID